MLKYNEQQTYLLLGVAMISIGSALVIWQNDFVAWITEILAVFIGGIGIWRLFEAVFSQKYNHSLKERVLQLGVAVLHFLFASWIFFASSLPGHLIVRLFGVYQLLIALVAFISYTLMLRDGVKRRFNQLISGIISLIIAWVALFSESGTTSVLMLIGIYLMSLGLTYISDARDLYISPERRRNMKRIFRIHLPIFLTALLPHSVQNRINQFIQSEITEDSTDLVNDFKYNLHRLGDKPPELEILIHVGESGFDAIGHVDIRYQNTVYSYGNHDSESRSFFDAIGPGVLVEANSQKYIDFCISNRSTVFGFGLQLTEDQKEEFLNALKKVYKQTKPFTLTTEKQKNDYIGKLYRATQAKLYKFRKGRFKTYFVLGTNCVLLANELVGSNGMDMINLVGILSPGTYYEYFNKEYLRPNSNVISKRMINQGIQQYRQEKKDN